MKMSPNASSVKTILPVLFVAGFAVTAFAHSTATGIVKERMESMKAIAQASKTVAAMMQGKRAYDPELVAEAGKVISQHSGQSLLKKFPEGSLDKPTEALNDIWRDWAGFSDLALALGREAQLLSKVAKNGPSGFSDDSAYSDDPNQPAGRVAKRMLKTCKGCHTKFRKDN